MDYNKLFESVNYFNETEIDKRKYKKEFVIAILTGVVFGLSHFGGLYFCSKIFEKTSN